MTKTTFKQRAANAVLAGTMALTLVPVAALATTVTMMASPDAVAFAAGQSIYINTMTNGTVTADKTVAGEGSTVTLTVTPDEGYVLDTIAAEDTNGDEVTLTQDATDSSKYTFTTPATIPVYVSATFKSSGGSSSGTGTTEVETDSIEVVYEKDCSWTATYPTSVTMAANEDGTASGTIDFTVKGLIDVDHQVTITPASETITLTGERHSGTLSASVTGGTAAAANVNSTSGATVSGSASATADAVSAAAVDSYKGTTTFTIQCAKPVTTYTVTLVKDGSVTSTLSVAEGTAYSVTGGDSSGFGTTLTIDGSTYSAGSNGVWRLVIDGTYTLLTDGDSGTITADTTFSNETYA